MFCAVDMMMAANAVSMAGSCPCKRVGAVIAAKIEEKWIVVGVGSNRSLRGAPGCDDIGCDLVCSQVEVDGILTQRHNCVRTVHAEINALADVEWSQAYKKPLVLFTNTYPCWHCFKTAVSFGVRGIFYVEPYNPDPRVKEYAEQFGVELFDMSGIMGGSERELASHDSGKERTLPTPPTD